VRFAYQGEPGAFSEAAAIRLKPDAEVVACHEFEDVFAVVESGRADYGVLPLENSVGGSVHRNYDLLMQHDLGIVAEVELPIVHHLLAPRGTALRDIRRVLSHPQALAQCERFLSTLGDVDIVATYNTAGSAKLVAQLGSPDTAAIASARAGEVFGLVSLAGGIQDFEHNITRFVGVGRQPLTAAPAEKTSIVFTVPNEAGMLFKALSVFALRGVDLMKLESRPIPGRPWEYRFYADLASASDAPSCARALAHLGEFAPVLRVLGSYPRFRCGSA